MANHPTLTSDYWGLLSLVLYFIHLNCNSLWENVVYGLVFLFLSIFISSKKDSSIPLHGK